MRTLLGIPLLLALSLGFSTAARATSPVAGTSTYMITGATPTVLGHADGNTFASVSFTEVDSGPLLAGSCQGSFTQVTHPDGSANFRGSEMCTGSVDSQAGTYSLSFVGTSTAAGFLQGPFVLSGTGALANLHGQGTFQGVGTSGTLTFTLHLDPS